MDNNEEKRHSMVSVQESSIPSSKATKVTIDNSYARIVVYEKEDLTNDEIRNLLNINRYIKIDIDKHYERIGDTDKHCYTVYNILI